MELSAFAHMAHRNVKVVQPGLVYVIEWQAFATSSSPTSESPSPSLPDKEDHQGEEDANDSTIYVAYVRFHIGLFLSLFIIHYTSYHDWEHFSSIRNLKGPHVGLPKVKERPAPTGDTVPSPVAEEYKPAKERKRAEKERERERKERKREKARVKQKHGPALSAGKGKQKADIEDTETDEEQEQEQEQERGVEPEKLKIKLKLTLNSNNSSSANISESENQNTGNRSTPQRTGLKLRLPPSRSHSAAPSNVSTPPTSHASTTSVSSTTTLSNTPSTSTQSTPMSTPPSTTSTSTSATTTAASVYNQALPHAQPPTHTAAPHLTESHDPTGSPPHRANRSPKRTFDESELEDTHSTTGRVRSRLCGPERGGAVDEEMNSQENRDVTMSTANGIDGEDEVERDGTAEREIEEREVARTLGAESVAAAATSGDGDEDDNEREEDYESDSASSSSLEPSLASTKAPEEGEEEAGTPTTSISNSPSSSSHQIHAQSQSQSPSQDSPTTPVAPVQPLRIPVKSQLPGLPGKAAVTRRQRREAALGVAAAAAVSGEGGEGRRLTRRQRKALGLPKVRRMAGPYDRRGGAGGGKEVNGEGKGEEEEWRRNGTGRVDVRGFRELRI